MRIFNAQISRRTTTAVLAILGVLALAASPGWASDGPTTTEISPQEAPGSSGSTTVATRHETAGTEPLDANGPGQTTRSCVPGQPVTVWFAQPQRSVQAVFDIKASNTETTGSVTVEVTYTASNWTSTFWRGATYGRPVSVETPVPQDGRGVNNVVMVTAKVSADPRGLSCDVEISWEGPLPELEQRCFAQEDVVFTYPTPQAAAQLHLQIASIPRGTASSVVNAYYTNSKGQEKWLGTTVGPSESHPDLILPRDGLGVYNVLRVRLRVANVSWANLLECRPSVVTAGDLPADESYCFSGEMDFTFVQAVTVQSRVTLAARESRGDAVLQGTGYLKDSQTASQMVLVPTSTDGGMPATEFLLPRDGNGFPNIDRLRLTYRGHWYDLLFCKFAVAEVIDRTPV